MTIDDKDFVKILHILTKTIKKISPYRHFAF